MFEESTPIPSELPMVMCLVRSLRLADGRALCVRIWPGTGDRTVVFLHGLLDSSEGWATTCERRDGADGRPTMTRIAFDIPGFGHSDVPSHASLDRYARDIAAGLVQLGVVRFTLVGHSLGGGVAARLAELMADQVDALLLFAPVGFGRIPLAELATLPGLLTGVGLGMPLALSNPLTISLGYRVMVANGKTPERELIDRVMRSGAHVVRGAREAVRAIAAAGTGPDGFSHRRITFAGPVIAVWGSQDRLVPVGHRRALTRALPQAHVEVWNGMGHHPQRERFEDVLDVIRRVSEQDRSRPERYVAPGAVRA